MSFISTKLCCISSPKTLRWNFGGAYKNVSGNTNFLLVQSGLRKHIIAQIKPKFFSLSNPSTIILWTTTLTDIYILTYYCGWCSWDFCTEGAPTDAVYTGCQFSSASICCTWDNEPVFIAGVRAQCSSTWRYSCLSLCVARESERMCPVVHWKTADMDLHLNQMYARSL
jgi:hypothetical protein